MTDSYVDPKHTVLATTRNQEQQKQKQQLNMNQCLLNGWDPTEIGQEQLKDPNIGIIYTAKLDGNP